MGLKQWILSAKQAAIVIMVLSYVSIPRATYANEFKLNDADTMLKNFNHVADLVDEISRSKKKLAAEQSTAANVHVECANKVGQTTVQLMNDTLNLSGFLAISGEMIHSDDEAIVNRIIHMRVSSILAHLAKRRDVITTVEKECSDSSTILDDVKAYDELEENIKLSLEQLKVRSQPKQ